jgi:hypothetical protein
MWQIFILGVGGWPGVRNSYWNALGVVEQWQELEKLSARSVTGDIYLVGLEYKTPQLEKLSKVQ